MIDTAMFAWLFRLVCGVAAGLVASTILITKVEDWRAKRNRATVSSRPPFGC